MPRSKKTSKKAAGSNVATTPPSAGRTAFTAGTKRARQRRRGNPFTALVREVRPQVDTRLRKFLDTKLEAARALGPEVAEMVLATIDLCMRGGKRLRPALLLAGYRSVDEIRDWETALEASLALELLQAFFLIHDDWMDQDATRRGGPTVHTHLAKRFRSEHLGHASAVLAGDYAASLATELLSRVDVRGRRGQQLFARFAEMQLDAIAGQQLDLIGQTRDPERTYRLKTSSYTVKGPLLLGAILGGGSPRQQLALERYALPIGVAFQLQDDLLSAFGDPVDTGKPYASDVRSGKRTMLVETALSMGQPSDKKALVAALGNPRATTRQLAAAVSALGSSGAEEFVRGRIVELRSAALQALETDVLSTTGKMLLTGAAEALTERLS